MFWRRWEDTVEIYWLCPQKHSCIYAKIQPYVVDAYGGVLVRFPCTVKYIYMHMHRTRYNSGKFVCKSCSRSGFPVEEFCGGARTEIPLFHSCNLDRFSTPYAHFFCLFQTQDVCLPKEFQMAVMKVHQMVWCLEACLHWFLLQDAYTVACHCPQHILLPLVGRSHHPPHKHVATADVVFDGHSVFSINVDIGSSIGVIRMWSKFTTTTIISGWTVRVVLWNDAHGADRCQCLTTNSQKSKNVFYIHYFR